MNVTLIKPIAHCFGVIHAISLAKKVREENKDKNIYIFGSLVHNESVINELKQLGIIYLEINKENAIAQLNKFSNQDIVIFSAHGHDEKYEEILKNKGVTFFDATCEKVKKAFEYIKEAEEVIYIGKYNHPEANAAMTMNDNCYFYDINGTFDYSKIKGKTPIVINQTTLSFLELKNIHDEVLNKLPQARIIDEICDATLLRQKAILNIKDDVDLVLVVGSKKSSNTQKLYEVAKSEHINKEVKLIENINDLFDLSKKYNHAVIASGTSTPMDIIMKIKEYLEEK